MNREEVLEQLINKVHTLHYEYEKDILDLVKEFELNPQAMDAIDEHNPLFAAAYQVSEKLEMLQKVLKTLKSDPIQNEDTVAPEELAKLPDAEDDLDFSDLPKEVDTWEIQREEVAKLLTMYHEELSGDSFMSVLISIKDDSTEILCNCSNEFSNRKSTFRTMEDVVAWLTLNSCPAPTQAAIEEYKKYTNLQ